MNDREMIDKLFSGDGPKIIVWDRHYQNSHRITSTESLLRHLSDDPIVKHKIQAEFMGVSHEKYNWHMSTDNLCIAICVVTGKRCKKLSMGSREHDGPEEHEDLFCSRHDPKTSKWEFKIKEYIPEEKTK